MFLRVRGLDFETSEEMHFHTIGNRCHCGYLTVPNRFHDRDSRGNVIGHKGPERYLAWLASDEKPAHVNPPVMEEVTRRSDTPQAGPVLVKLADVSREDKKCVTCEKVFTGRGKVCHACRQAAYRRRHA